MSRKMTLTVEFMGHSPDERRELTMTIRARELALVIHCVDEKLRSRLKYADLSHETHAELQAIRDLLHSELGDLQEAVFG